MEQRLQIKMFDVLEDARAWLQGASADPLM